MRAQRYWVLVGLLLLAALLAGCGRQSTRQATAVQPTIAPIFDDLSDLETTQILPGIPTTTVVPMAATSLTPERVATTAATTLPTRVAGAAATPTPSSGTAVEEENPFDEVLVYDDALASGWNLRFSDGVNVNITSTGAAYDGLYSVQAIPIKPYGDLIFGVVRDAPRTYLREDVLGVRFRVSGGDVILPNDSLIVTVYGSKEFSHYVDGDISATFPEGRIVGEEPLFPETRLYFLDVNRDILPGEWAEVVVWLDEHFTPDYTYVTGIRIRNDENYLDPYYVDDVALIVQKS